MSEQRPLFGVPTAPAPRGVTWHPGNADVAEASLRDLASVHAGVTNAGADGLPEAAWAAALCDCAGVGGARLQRDLLALGPRRLWERLMGERQTLGGLDAVIDRWARCERLGIDVTWLGDARYPALLASDPDPPPVLFWRGDLAALDARRAAVVGTRNATAAGRDVAFRFGAELASHGVAVVSGLARGIDGCAHRGALSVEAGVPVGVVGSGLDVVYPRAHHALWDAVAERGVLLSEHPPGTEAHGYHFPRRNRIVAALAEVVVVVESRETGGSLITAEEALRRGVSVLAVPGGVHNRAARGTNALVRDGATIALDTLDVLVAMSIEHRDGAPLAALGGHPEGGDGEIYDLCCDEPSTFEGLVERSGRDLREVAMSVARLDRQGWITLSDGWFEAREVPR